MRTTGGTHLRAETIAGSKYGDILSFHILLCLSTVDGELWCWEKGDDLCVQVVWSEVDSMLKMIARLLILNDAPLAK